jgi:anaerobic C4-dicarboxylate transporter
LKSRPISTSGKEVTVVFVVVVVVVVVVGYALCNTIAGYHCSGRILSSSGHRELEMVCFCETILITYIIITKKQSEFSVKVSHIKTYLVMCLTSYGCEKFGKTWFCNSRKYMKNAIFWDVTPCGSCKNRHRRRLLSS